MISQDTLRSLENAVHLARPEQRAAAELTLQLAKAAVLKANELNAKLEAVEKRAAEAETRAELAEEVVARVRPAMAKMEEVAENAVYRAAEAERKVLKRAVRKSEQDAEAALDDAVKMVSKAISSLGPMITSLTILYRRIKDENGVSIFTNKSEDGFEWVCMDVYGIPEVVFSKRSEAIAYIREQADLDAIERGADTSSLDEDRKRDHGANISGAAVHGYEMTDPGVSPHGGRLDGKKIGSRKRRGPRIV